MRMKVLVGAFLLLLVFGALPAADAQVSRKIYLPLIARDPTPVPTVPIHIQYRAYVQDLGWLDWQSENGSGDGAGIAGTIGQSRRVEGLEMRIASGPPGAKVQYRALVQDTGWEGSLRENGQTAGLPGSGKAVESIQVGLFNPPTGQLTYVHVDTFVADWGWLGWVPDFWMAGTSGQGRRMEAFRAFATPAFKEPAHIHVAYNANPRGLGYTGWKRDGEEAGTRGESRPLNTFKAVLYNHPDNMILRYRCYVQDQGWQDFTDGECGNFSADKDIYAMEMRFEGSSVYPGTVLSYGAHIANRGDVNFASDSPGSNPIVGNPDDRFRLESIRIGIGNQQP